MRNGRPLRFLAVVLGGWTAVRVVILWSGNPPPALVLSAVPKAAARPIANAGAFRTPPPGMARAWPIALRPVPRTRRPVPRTRRIVPLPSGAVAGAAAHQPPPDGILAAAASIVDEHQIMPPLPKLTAGLPAADNELSRWSASFWLVARRGSGSGQGFSGPQLGGSQAGARIAYLLDRRHRVAITARVASPLGNGQRDAAIGIAWQPFKLPIRIVAEQRFTLGPGRGGPTIGLIGGFGPAAIGHGLRLEGYGQAGYIARRDGEGFADGALRLSHPLASIGRTKFDLGAATWGAVQKGAARVDVGPSLGWTVPVAHHAMRVSIEWRARVAGNAQPVSGPALSLGADF
jgi:hypothetical protein